MSKPTATTTLGELVSAFAARSSTPGGGAAAASVAAIAAALGAMAANYTTGKKWQDREAEAKQLADQLTTSAEALLNLADEDAAAFGALQAAQKNTDEAAVAAASQRCIAVPLAILDHCAQAATALAAFNDRCNPYLRSDLRAALHLLSGAAGAAHEMVLINEPDDQQREDCARLTRTIDGKRMDTVQ